VYQMTSWAWKGIQELSAITDAHADDIQWLKIENQFLKQKIKTLEEKIA